MIQRILPVFRPQNLKKTRVSEKLGEGTAIFQIF